MKIQNVKGGYDFLPQEQKIRNYVNDILKQIFEEYGYKPIETPILCYYDILSDKYDKDNDILNEIYKLTDRGKRKLGLRYDLTVPFAKLIALNKNEISFPFKRYEIAKAFRDGPVKPGRDREFTQCDVDVVGLSGQLIEAELMTLFIKAFKKLDIDIIIKYNNRKLMNGLILECGIDKEKLAEVTTIIDKKEKISKDEFKNNLLNIDVTEVQVIKLFDYFELSLEKLNKKFKNTLNDNIKDGLNEINNLSNYLNGLGINNICEFDITLARGQNYYTGNVYEVYEKNNKLSCSIAAGGRYDKMITDFIKDGNSYPAVGISFGLSSIYELLKAKEIFNNKSLTNIYIIPINTELESLKIANILRNSGYKVEIEMNNKKLKKALDFANKENIKYVLILGEDELKNNNIILKYMDTGDQEKIKINNLIKKISCLNM